MGLCGIDPVEHFPRKLPRPFLFGHEQCRVFEIRLVHLHDMLENMVLVGQMGTKLTEPMPYRLLREIGQRGRLENGSFDRPAPEEHPELLVW